MTPPFGSPPGGGPPLRPLAPPSPTRRRWRRPGSWLTVIRLLYEGGYSAYRITECLNESAEVLRQLRQQGIAVRPTPDRQSFTLDPEEPDLTDWQWHVLYNRLSSSGNPLTLAHLCTERDPLCGGDFWTPSQVRYHLEQLIPRERRRRRRAITNADAFKDVRESKRWGWAVLASWHGWGHLLPQQDMKTGEVLTHATVEYAEMLPPPPPSLLDVDAPPLRYSVKSRQVPRLELRPQEVRILDALWDGGEMTLAELAKKAIAQPKPKRRRGEKNTATRKTEPAGSHAATPRLRLEGGESSLNRLVAAGYVERQGGTGRRPVIVRLGAGIAKHERSTRPDGIELRLREASQALQQTRDEDDDDDDDE